MDHLEGASWSCPNITKTLNQKRPVSEDPDDAHNGGDDGNDADNQADDDDDHDGSDDGHGCDGMAMKRVHADDETMITVTMMLMMTHDHADNNDTQEKMFVNYDDEESSGPTPRQTCRRKSEEPPSIQHAQRNALVSCTDVAPLPRST